MAQQKELKDIMTDLPTASTISAGDQLLLKSGNTMKTLDGALVAKSADVGKVGLSFVRSGANALPVSIKVKANQYLVMYAEDPDGVGSEDVVLNIKKYDGTVLYPKALFSGSNKLLFVKQESYDYEVTVISTDSKGRTQNVNIDVVDTLQDSIIYRMNKSDVNEKDIEALKATQYNVSEFYERSGEGVSITLNRAVSAGSKIVIKAIDSVADSTNKIVFTFQNAVGGTKYPGKFFNDGEVFWVVDIDADNVLKNISVTDKTRNQKIYLSIVDDLGKSILYNVNSSSCVSEKKLAEIYPSNCTADKFLYNIKRKLCVIVDDDGNPDGMWRITDVCDAKGIKATFAVITNKFSIALENYGTRLDYYKSLQDQGYDFACHSYSHSSKWYNTSAFDLSFVLEDLAKAYRDMMDSGLLSRHPCFVYPGSCGDSSDSTGVGGMRKTRNAVRNFFDFACRAGHGTPTAPIDNCNAMQMERFFLHPTQDAEKTSFKAYVTACEAVGKAPILATHSADETNDHWSENPNYIQECVEYLLGKGYEFVTLSQLAEILTPMKNAIGMYSPNV